MGRQIEDAATRAADKKGPQRPKEPGVPGIIIQKLNERFTHTNVRLHANPPTHAAELADMLPTSTFPWKTYNRHPRLPRSGPFAAENRRLLADAIPDWEIKSILRH
jgi:hypothetical protein